MRPADRGAATAGGPASEVARVEAAVAAAFGADGPLSRRLPGFVARASQRELALAVLEAIVARETLIAEAGTGTGKTFAYLVPALLAGGKLLISAGTKTLQDQIFHRDLVAICNALDLRVDVALLKGRQNYVCRLRLARTEQEGLLGSRDEVRHLREVVRFAARSASGDRAELTSIPEQAPIWQTVTSSRENCLGAECPHIDDCFVYQARRRAQVADVVVVNHHLFLADLALRDDTVSELLPDCDTVVLDEAHQLPRIAADFFGSGWSLAQIGYLTTDVRAIGLARAADGAPWVGLTQAVEDAARRVRAQLAEGRLLPGARVALEALPRPAAQAEALERLAGAVDAVRQAVAVNSGRDAELDLLAPRARQLAQAVRGWVTALRAPADSSAGDDDAPDIAHASLEPNDEAQDDGVRWISLTTHGATFQMTPLSPATALARAREARAQAWILTSATLTLAGSFDQYLTQVGLAARCCRWESPFDFARQALLYLPLQTPPPLAGDYAEQCAEIAWPVIAAAEGRAFILCSTLRAVERIADRLRRLIEEAGVAMTVFEQGTSTRSGLLDAFRRAEHAVLVGSVSFWEGIDVRGEALSVVVIDKLPFAPPDDPVVAAQIRRLRATGANPFLEFQLPAAVTLLQQGAGRLIRSESDLGVLMLLDERVMTKSYGKLVLDSLPPFTRTRDLAAVQRFLRNLREQRR